MNQSHEDDYDLDYFSIKIKYAHLYLFATVFQITARKSYDVRDERAKDWIAFTMPPLEVMIDGHKEQVIRAMRRNKVMVCPHEDPEIFAASAGRVILATQLSEVLEQAGFDEVIISSFGLKSRNSFFMKSIDEGVAHVADPRNWVDIGISLKSFSVIVCQLQKKRKSGWSFAQSNFYPIFGHLAEGYICLDFIDQDESSKVKIYPLWVHCLRSTLKRPDIPAIRRNAPGFKETYAKTRRASPTLSLAVSVSRQQLSVRISKVHSESQHLCSVLIIGEDSDWK